MTRRQIVAALVLSCFCAGLAMAEDGGVAAKRKVTKGEIAGKVTKVDKTEIKVKGDKETLTLMPYWRGGSPKEGGCFDKAIVAKMKDLKVGDNVKVAWTHDDHYRIDSLEKVP